MNDHDKAMARLLKEIAELRAEIALIKLIPVQQPPPVFPKPTLKKSSPISAVNQWH